VNTQNLILTAKETTLPQAKETHNNNNPSSTKIQIPQDLPFQVNLEYFKSLDAEEQLTKEEVEGYIAYAVTA
jgi:hypothetical protein